MSSYLLLDELAEKTGYKMPWLRGLAKRGELPYLYKKKIKRIVGGRKKKKHVVERMMWAVDEEKLDALKDFLVRLKIKNSKKEARSLKWTRSAIECFQANLICSNCPNYQVCKDIESHEHCKPIKEKTIALFKMYGAPPERIFEDD